MSIISLPRQQLKHHPDQAVIPAEKPRGVEPRRLPCAPGTSRHVLDELRAETAPVPPTALRQAFDRPAPTWLPAIGLRPVPLASVVRDDIATTAAALAQLHAAAEYVPLPIRLRIAAIVEQLAEVSA